MFGTPSSTPAFGTLSSPPAFGTPSPIPAFGTPSSPPAFATPSSMPAFGTPSSTPAFGAPSSTLAFGNLYPIPAFGTPSSAPAFGTPSSTPAFGMPSSAPAFGTPSSTPAFGSLLSTPSFFQQQPSSTPAFGAQPPSPFFQQQPQQQQLQSFGLQPTSLPFANAQITTQMAPVAPLQLPPAERDLHAIIDAYKEDPGNLKYSFRYLLLSVTDPAARVKPVGASDIMWAEAMEKLAGMDSSERERLWPQLVQGCKDLSDRLKLQDEVLVSDAERLRISQANAKLLQRHFQADILQWVRRLKLKEQALLRRVLRVMRIVEMLESKGYRIPLTKGEIELSERLSAIARQLKPGAELPRKAQNLLSVSRLRASTGELSSSIYIPGSMKIQEQSLSQLQEVLQQENEAIAKLANVLKRDVRDVEIILSEGTDMEEGARSLKS